MTIKAVETVRKIRDRHHELTQGMSVRERRAFYRKKARQAMKKAQRQRGQAGPVTKSAQRD
jgi:hypothetical protein